jgi:predicted nucleotidyltransferase
MTIEEIKQLVESEQYDFLRSNEHLKNKIVFLTLGGSYSYGTNIDTSDVDIRGCALNSRSDLLGLSNFEQVVNNTTDTTVYSFNKLINLLLNCNPNTIEMLGCKPEHYIYLNTIGEMMISSRKMFLSKKAVYSFGGYANQQLRRLENALARDRLPQSRKEEHILKSMKNAMKSFSDRYTEFDSGSIGLFIDKSNRDDLDTEIYTNISLIKYPARELSSIMNDLTNIVSSYDKLTQRNKKKDDNHLNKHAMHLVRLYLMCLDILEKEDIITYRENDLDMLRSIRAGEYQKSDGTYRNEFFELIDELDRKLNYAKENTSLPAHPDMKKVEEFVMAVNRRAIDV